MVYNFFDKKLSGGGIKNENMLKQESADELHRPFVKKFGKRKVYSFLKTMFGVLILPI